MPKKRNVRLFFVDMLDAIGRIKTYTQGMSYERFMQDEKTKDAVLRNLEIVGEAVKNIPDKIKKRYSEVDWKVVAGMRDKLIHEYFGVSNQIVWETIESELPLFEAQIKKILEEEGEI